MMLQSSISLFNVPVVIVKLLGNVQAGRPSRSSAAALPHIALSSGGQQLVNGCT